jgi:flagellar hook protein FlgE
MFRSLYSGVSGLNANLVEIDVIGNNIANSNTIGFKSGRVTFSEMLTQSLRAASRPVSGGRGGTNPQQVGLGTQVGGIDSDFTQGNFQTTGVKTDLALQGQGFFILSDGIQNTYTRAGVFGLDSENNLVNPSTGLRVQGVLADENGEIQAGVMQDIYIDPSLVMPAEASTMLSLSGNLDSDSDAVETVLESNSFLVAAEGGDELIHLAGQRDGFFDLHEGDLISVSVMVNDSLISPSPFVVGGIYPAGGSTYQDLVNWLDETFQTGQGMALDFSIGADGSLQVQNNTGDQLVNLSLSVGGKANFNVNFQFPNSILAGETASTANGEAGELRAPAQSDDLFSQLYNEDGQSLDLDLSGGSTTIEIQGTRGGEAITRQAMTVDATTRVSDFLTALQAAFRISSNPVEMNEEGQIIMHGEVGTANALGDVSITEVRAAGSTNSIIESSFTFLQTQQARDEQQFSTATTVYDSLGGAHTINFTFQKVSGINEWIWSAEMEGNEELMMGATGRVRFTESGAVSNFSFDDGSSTLVFRPQPVGEEGAELVSLSIDYGDIGGVNGLTQFEGRGSLQSIADGITAGQLVDFEIDQNGLVIGQFSNDSVRNLARIGIAMFSNPAGLVREANNTYRRSGNSGQAIETFAGEDHGTVIVPGTLETSNVDLAEQFTRLVIAQRAFQANSRVISTSDEIMQELVTIIR